MRAQPPASHRQSEHTCKRTATDRGWLALALTLGLAGCAGPSYTVDDGRPVSPELLGRIETWGQGERALRPAIARSAALKDADCSHQWELPFSVMSSADWEKDDRVAWVRALNVDERLTVVGTTPEAGLQLGQKLVEIDGYRSKEQVKMLERLARLRDFGQPFSVTTANRKTVTVKPFEVCRGYTRLSPPNTPALQDYHWLMSYHPLEIAQADLTPDEALWTVLWTQGVSEEGGLRMKAFKYGSDIVGTLYTVATIATGLRGAAVAAEAAISTAQQAAANVATELLKQQLIDQAKQYAAGRVKEELGKQAQTLTQAQVAAGMQAAATNRGLLGGVSRVAATAFDEADGWAWSRMQKLGADPLSAFSLHQKLLERSLVSNALVLDPERMTLLQETAERAGRADEVTTLLKGIRPETLEFESEAMPIASAERAFSFDDASARPGSPFSMGLVEGLLGLPTEAR